MKYKYMALCKHGTMMQNAKHKHKFRTYQQIKSFLNIFWTHYNYYKLEKDSMRVGRINQTKRGLTLTF